MSAAPRVAVVGAGPWGLNHVRTLQALGALAGVVEAEPEAAARVRAQCPGLPVWDGLAAALDEPLGGGRAVEGVVIATPAPTHASLACEALVRGRGVLVEKPMTLASRDAAHLVEVAAARNQVLMVGHLPLFQPALRELKALLDGGALGRVLRVHLERLGLGRVRETEDVLWSLAPHDVAVLLHLMGGPPRAVAAAGAAHLQPGIHDDVHLELAFTGGRSAHVHVSWYWPGRSRVLRVMGEAGMAVLDEADQTLTLHRKRLAGGEGPGRLAAVDEGAERLFQGGGQPLTAEDALFLHCLATGTRPFNDGQSGLDVVRVLERASAQLCRLPQPLAKES
ncbi:MAG TPA: Gfo/Idh/MocA family oxidoreductase [Holophaga sp.]|nr:Gfo/Idh/MocA family oxidoreductase [Holophaga sp.]